MAEFLPSIIVTPLVGAWADRFDRRILSIIGQVLAGLQAATLCFITAAGLVTPQLIFALAIFNGVVFPLVQAARLTLVPSLLDKKDMTAAIAITAIIFNVTRIVGTALAGVIIATLGAATAFGINAVSFIAVIFALLALDIKPEGYRPVQRAKPPWRRLTGAGPSVCGTPPSTAARQWAPSCLALYHTSQPWARR